MMLNKEQLDNISTVLFEIDEIVNHLSTRVKSSVLQKKLPHNEFVKLVTQIHLQLRNEKQQIIIQDKIDELSSVIENLEMVIKQQQ